MTENLVSEPRQERHTLRKILYAALIGLSGLVVLISLIVILASWLLHSPLVEAAVTTMKVVERTAAGLDQPIQRVDASLEKLEKTGGLISNASAQIGQNIEDKGLVLTLLPESTEQELAESAQTAQETLAGVRQTLTTGLELYRAINRIPFVDLPRPDKEQAKKLEASLARVKTRTEELRSEIADFRSGLSGRLDRVDRAVTALTDEIFGVREDLARLQIRLNSLEAFALRMQQVIPSLLFTAELLLTLLLAFIIYTQIEVIGLFVARWKALGQPVEEEQVLGESQPVVAEGNETE
jgi:cell division protein FtsL